MDYTNIIYPILEQLTKFDMDFRTAKLAGFMAIPIAYVGSQLFSPSDEDIQNRMIKELFILDNFPTSHSKLADRYREIIMFLGFLTIWVTLLSIISCILHAGSIYKIVSLSRNNNYPKFTSSDKERLCEIETVAKRLIEDKQRTVNDTHNELDQYFSKKEEILRTIYNIYNHEIVKMSADLKNQVDQQKAAISKMVDKFFEDYKSSANVLGNIKRKVDSFSNQCDDLNNSVGKLKKEFNEKHYDITNSIKDINFQMSQFSNKIEQESSSLINDRNLLKVQLYKSKIHLVSSQILFDASLSKFELVNDKINYLITSDEPLDNEQKLNIQERLFQSLKKAVKLTNMSIIRARTTEEEPFHSSSEFLDLTAEISDLESKLTNQDSLVENSDSIPTNYETYFNSTDLIIGDFNQRLESLESKVEDQNKLSKSEELLFSDLKDFTNKAIFDFKQKNEKWISGWLSVLYGLFKSGTNQLGYHSFGLEQLDSLISLEKMATLITFDGVLIESFVIRCKETCLELLKQSSLLLFEFHLLTFQGSNQDKILKECEQRITMAFENIFSDFKKSVLSSELSMEDAAHLFRYFLSFEEKIKKDLISVVNNYNSSFKDNVAEFYIVFEGLKQVSNYHTEESNPDISESVISVHSKDDISLPEKNSHSTTERSWGFESSMNSE